MSREDIRGVAYLEDDKVVRTPDAELLTDFDKLPIPDFSVVRFAKIRIYPVGRVRGCGMNCEVLHGEGEAPVRVARASGRADIDALRDPRGEEFLPGRRPFRAGPPGDAAPVRDARGIPETRQGRNSGSRCRSGWTRPATRNF